MQSFDVIKQVEERWETGHHIIYDAKTNLVKVNMWDDDGSEFWFARLFPCPELKTIYVTELYGFHYDYSPDAEYDLCDVRNINVSRCQETHDFYTNNFMKEGFTTYKTEEDVHPDIQDKAHCIHRIGEVILTNCPEFLHFKKYEEFTKEVAEIKANISAQLVPIANVFTPAITTSIGRHLIPSWTKQCPPQYPVSLKEYMAIGDPFDGGYAIAIRHFPEGGL